MAGTHWTSAVELARMIGGDVDGDAARRVSGVATLEAAGEGDVSWAGGTEQMPRAAESKAGVLVVPRGVTLPPMASGTIGDGGAHGRTIIRVDDPDAAMNKVLAYFAPPRDDVPVGVHPTATVGAGAVVDGAAIGARVYVGAASRVGAQTVLHAGVYVGRDSIVGRDCILWPNVVVREGVTLGDRVVIHPNSTIGADGFGYLFRDGAHHKIPQIGTVVIDDDVEIGANSTIDRARSGVTRIGRGTKIDNLVQIGHNVEIGEHCIIVAGTGISGSCKLGKYVVLAGQAGVSDHVTIGDGAAVAGNSSTFKDVAAGAKVRGNPAQDVNTFHREQAALRKLPELLRRVKELEKKGTKARRHEGTKGEESGA